MTLTTVTPAGTDKEKNEMFFDEPKDDDELETTDDEVVADEEADAEEGEEAAEGESEESDA